MKIQGRREGGVRFAPAAESTAPLLSIIVVVLRDRDELGALIENIGQFRGPSVELILIDGGSDDGTSDLLQSARDVIDYWLSEPDDGVYAAMNKGIAAARGEYILHLNAGDRLLCVPTSELLACSREKVDVACFRVLLEDGSVHIPKSDCGMSTGNAWHHQGTFYRRAAHLGYDTTYKVFGDFDHNQRLAKTTKSVRVFPNVISRHGNPGLSGSKAHFSEVYKSIRKNQGVLYLPLAFLRFKVQGMRRRFARLSFALMGKR